MDFNKTKDSYRDHIEKTIAFAGKNLDFFTLIKANYLRKIVEAELPSIKIPKLIDIGCGHGYIHSILQRFGYDITGTEVAQEVLQLARKANPNVNYIEYDGKNLHFEVNSFDVGLAICVMHHVPPDQWKSFLREAYNVLRPGGIMVVFEHNPLNPLTRYVVASNEIDHDAVLLRANTLRKLFRDAGFTNVRSRNIIFTPFDNSIFRRLDEMLGWLPFGAQYYTIGAVT